MKWHIVDRASGKTTKLIIESYIAKSVIVCRNISECKRIIKLTTNLGMTIPEPISYFDFMALGKNTNKIKYLIDEIDDLIEYIFGNKIAAVTLTPKDIL